MLSAENYTLEELESKVERSLKDYVILSGRKKEFLILEQAEGITKQKLMEKLVQTDIDVEKFGRYEPSLNDIFVAKVGEECS